MKTFLSIVILTFLFQQAFSQSRKDIEKEWGLYKSNKVKTRVCKYENYYDKIGYDVDGKPTLLEIYDLAGNVTNGLEYNYDANNNLVKEAGFTIINKKKTFDEESSRTHEYDVSGNRTKSWEIEYNIEYVYDSNGFLIETHEESAGDGGKAKSMYRYNEKGQLKIIRIENPDGTKEIREHAYYDTDNIIDTRYHHATNDWKAIDAYIIENRTYYDNGLMKNVSSNKQIKEEYTYEYY